jgi:chitin disaccharide deacetylase
MEPNPVLRRLGLSATDRVAIIHADDIGMCQASVDAFADLWGAGIVTAGAVMVPCPWFLHAAAWARANPGADLGVHLTLTCEWETYRWGPVSTRDPRSGMVDGEGCFYRTTPEAQAHGRPRAMGRELHEQVRRALGSGIDVTHVDTHMGTVAHPALMRRYADLALANQVPAMILRPDEAAWRALGLSAPFAHVAAGYARGLERRGMPLLDRTVGMPLDSTEDRLELTKRMLSALPAGVTHFIIHPSRDTPELRAIAPQDWACRAADHRTWTGAAVQRHLRDIGVHAIGYRALRGLMRGA